MTATSASTEHRVALPPGRLFIDGRWSDAAGGTRDVVNPATGSVLMEAAEASADDVDRAVAAARRAFDSGPWPANSALPGDRGFWAAPRVLADVAQNSSFVQRRSSGRC